VEVKNTLMKTPNYFTLKISLLFVLFFSIFSNTFGQNPIEKNKSIVAQMYEDYETIIELYQDGRPDSVLRVMDHYMAKPRHFSRVSKSFRASFYRIIAHSYILLDSLDEAEVYVKKMMAYSYVEQDDDLQPYKDIIDKFYTIPKLSFGIRGGTNITTIDLIKQYSVFEFNDGKKLRTNYDFGVGFQLGAMVSYALNKHLTGSFEPSIVQHQFKYEAILEDLKIDYTYKQTIRYIDLPVIVKYNFMVRQKYVPYLQGGLAYRQLLTATRKVETSNIDVSSLLSKGNIGVILGGGFSWKTSKYTLNIDGRYKYNLNKINNESNRYLNDNLSDIFIYKYYDAGDDISLNNFQVSLGVTYHLSQKVVKK
jgi:hypothetical protein